MLQKFGFFMVVLGVVLLIFETIIFLIEVLGETFHLSALTFLFIPAILIIFGILAMDDK